MEAEVNSEMAHSDLVPRVLSFVSGKECFDVRFMIAMAQLT